MERSVDCGRVAKQEALFETESTTGNRAVVTTVLRETREQAFDRPLHYSTTATVACFRRLC